MKTNQNLPGESMPRTVHDLLPGDSFTTPAASLGKGCNGNAYTARGSYRTADGKAQIDWTLAAHREDGRALFSACGEFNGGMGQCIDRIAKAYPNDSRIQEIAKVWEVYHLNDMHPECEHQRAAGWRELAAKKLTLVSYGAPRMEAGKVYPSQAGLFQNLKGWVTGGAYNVTAGGVVGRAVYIGGHSGMNNREYSSAIASIHRVHVAKPKNPADARVLWFAETFGCKRNEETKTAGWVTEDEHPEGILSKACPVCGYRYGSAWQHMEIPAEVVEQIKSWAAADNTAGESHHDAAARLFLENHGITLRITLSDTKPANWEPAGHHYRITLSRPGQTGKLAFDFWGSVHDAETGKDPSAYDILSGIASDLYTPDSFEDFCSEYGEDSDSRKALQTFNRAHKHAQRLRAFFSDENEREELSEIR